MMIGKKMIVWGLLCSGLLAFAAEIPLNEQAKIKFQNIAPLFSGGKLRMVENGPKRMGTAKMRIAVGKNKYLQITAGASENPAHYLTVSNVSFRSRPAGAVFQGINTFVLPDKNFTLSLNLIGPRGTHPGGWYDVEAIRTVKTPIGGVVIESAGQCIKLNSTFTVKYYAAEPLKSDIEAKAFLSSSMAAVSFGKPIMLNDRGVNGDEKANDNIYSGQVTVSSKASALGSEKKPLPGSAMIFSVTLPDESSSFAVPAQSFHIATANKLPRTATRLTPLASKYRNMWYEAVKGENLALGRPVEFSVEPNFYLTTTGGKKHPNRDRFDLTDGELSIRGDDILRFDHHAVGWRDKLLTVVDMVVDLGKVQPVKKCVIRINCGDNNRNVQRSPRRLAVLVSKDNVNYYPAAAPMIKLQPGERDQSDFKTQFYLEENDRNIFCYPFELQVSANARYVMLRVVADGGNLYCDEWAVIKAAESDGAFEQAYTQTPEKRLNDCLVIGPAEPGTFFVADNLPAPNYFFLRDLRVVKKRAALRMVLEVPAGIRCINETVSAEKITLNGLDYMRYSFAVPADPARWNRFMESFPVFLQADPKLKNPAAAYFYMIVDGKKSHVVKHPVKIITLPENKEFFRGYTVLSRMGIGDGAWPGYFSNLRKLGFSAAQIYPYMFQRRGTDDFSEEYCSNVRKAHDLGYKVIFGYNGLLDMYRYSPHKKETFCQDIVKKNNHCPTYRGQAYIDELAKITRAVAKFKPVLIQWDIEHWGRSLPFWRKCSRCQEAFKKSGLSWEDFLDKISVELNEDLNKAVADGAKNGKCVMPKLYNYNRHSLSTCYHGFEKWSLNGKFVDGGQPSLYVAGNEMIVHDRIASNFANQRDKSLRTLLPVLTPGTYGAYEPYHLEQMIYEVMLNGGAGFFYYPWRGFVSPIYFYYHSKAMKNIIEHQKLIFEGEIFKPVISSKNMYVSGVKNSDEALLLIGNYPGLDSSCQVTLPFAKAEVIDQLTGKPVSNTELKNLPVEMKKIRLLYVKRIK